MNKQIKEELFNKIISVLPDKEPVLFSYRLETLHPKDVYVDMYVMRNGSEIQFRTCKDYTIPIADIKHNSATLFELYDAFEKGGLIK